MNSNVGIVKYSVYHVRLNDYKIIWADANFTKITGYTKSDYTEKTLKHTDLIPKLDMLEYHDLVNKYKNKELDTPFLEHRLVKKNGEYIVVYSFKREYTNPKTGDKEAEYLIADITNSDVITAVQAEGQNYAIMAQHDALTGLFNRGTFEKKVNANLQDSSESKCSMMLIDIDNMKVFNDIYGQQAGDFVINSIAIHLISLCKNGTIVSRIGGDEFCIFVPYAESKEAQSSFNKKIIQKIKNIKLPEYPGIYVSASIGTVELPRKEAEFQTLYNYAEIALLHAKSSGKNRAEMFNKSLSYSQSVLESVLIVSRRQKVTAETRKMFESRFRIIEANNTESAIDIIDGDKDSIALVLSDMYAHEIDGFTILDYMRKMDYIKKVPIVFLASDYIEDVYKNAFSHGVIDIVTEPIDAYSLCSRLNNIIELYQHKNHLEEMTRQQTEKIKSQNVRIIDSLGTVVEFRDMESGAHIMRVKMFTKILAQKVMQECPEYELTNSKIEMITEASPLHDVGKIAISDTILLKPGKLTKEEFELMKMHTTKGYDIIMKIFDDEDKKYKMYCSSIARYHHEKYDGRGYPEGIAGDDIPICAQIVSLADAYDALLSKRCYKDAYSYDTAFDMIMNGECGAYNPKLLACFKSVKSELEKHADRLHD